MKYLILILTILIIGCTKDPVEDCINKKQQIYREAHPKDNYSQATAANERFRKECKNIH